MPRQKKPITDWVDAPNKPEITDWVEVPSEEKSALEKGIETWDQAWFNQGLLKKGINALAGSDVYDPHAAAEFYDDPSKRTEDQWRIPSWVGAPLRAVGLESIDPSGGTYRSLGAGLLEGAGETLNSLSTPLNLATMGAGRYARGLATTARGLEKIGDAVGAANKIKQANRALMIEKALSAPMIGTGAAHVYEGVKHGDPSKAFFGVTEMAGGGAAAGTPRYGATPHPAPTPTPELPTGQLELPFSRGERGPSQQYLPGMDPFAPPEPTPTIKEIYDLTDRILGVERRPEVSQEVQGELDFGPNRNRAGRFSTEVDWEPGPLLNEGNAPRGQLNLFPTENFQRPGPEISETPPVTPPEPPPPPGGGGQDSVISKPNWTNEEIMRLLREGYESGGVDPQTNWPRMIKKAVTDFAKDTKAEFNPDPFINLLKDGLRRLLGRDATPEELEVATNRAHQVAPTDPRITGIRPEFPEPETPPPSGVAGPPSAGYQGPISELELRTSRGEGGNPLQQAIERHRARMQEEVNAELGVEPEKRGGAVPDELDDFVSQFETPQMEIVDPSMTDVNASGESAASAEALSRQSGMRSRGEQYVVYDRAGNRRPLIGPDAVDYRARPGETYGVEGPDGFRILDDRGGKAPSGGGFIKKFLKDEAGTFDPDALREELRRLLGRMPTLHEIQQYAFTKNRGADVGDQTGRVAPFLSPEERAQREADLRNQPGEMTELPVSPDEIPDFGAPNSYVPEYPNAPEPYPGPHEGERPPSDESLLQSIITELEDRQLLDNYLALSDRIDQNAAHGIETPTNIMHTADLVQTELIARGWDSRSGKFPNDIPTDIKQWETLPHSPWGIAAPEAVTERHISPPERLGQQSLKFGPSGEVRPPELDIFGFPKNQDIPPEAAERIRKQLEDQLMASYGEDTVEGQRAVNELRQQERMRLVGREADQLVRYTNEPRQQSMIPDFQDAEITNYLRNEDAIPPEMRDLETGQAPKRRWSEELKRFITDESGSAQVPDVESIIRWINDRYQRARGRRPTPEELNQEILRAREMIGAYTYHGMRDIELPDVTIYSGPNARRGLNDMLTSMETGGPVQGSLESGQPYFSRPSNYMNEPYNPNTYAEARMKDKAAQIARLREEALAAENAGDFEVARAKRAEVAGLRGDIDYPFHRTVTKSEELMARADREKDPAIAERLRKRADQLLLEEMGQQRLKFGQERKRRLNAKDLGITEEMVKRVKRDLDPSQMSEGLGRYYAQSTLAGIEIDPNRPGLDVQDYPYSMGASVVYRDPSGKPIAYAHISLGETTSLAVDEKAGLLQGRAVVAVVKEIIKRNATLPSGTYSPFTKAILTEMVRLFEESNGSFDITPFFRAYKTGGALVGRAYGRMKQLLGQTTQSQQAQAGINWVKEMLQFPSAATTTGDFSAPGRQGMTQVLTPEFWKAAFKMFGGLHAGMYDAMDANLRAKPLFQDGPINPRTGLPEPSLAAKAGVRLFEPASKVPIGARAEGIASRWLETGGFLGPEKIAGIPNPLRAAWYHTAGYPIRATNRAWLTFLNQLNANRFEYLMNRAADASGKALATGHGPIEGFSGGFNPSQFRFGLGKIMPDIDIGLSRDYTATEAMNMNPYFNLELAKEIGEFTNAATGHATGRNFAERAVQRIGPILFSPKFLISRMRFLNPATYVMGDGFVRRQYLKSAIGAAMGWYAFTQMSKMIAQANGEDSEIVDDPTNSDFGKFRIGNTRLDFGGSFLQFAVLLGRMYKGGWTSSSNPQEGMHEFGQDFPPETMWTTGERFLANRLNPAAKFAYDVANASKQRPFAVKDRTLQLFVNLFAQDLTELYKRNPELLPWMAPVLFGAGTQTYEKGGEYLGQPDYKFVPPEEDWIYEGAGGLKQMMPWNWGEDADQLTP